jgi:threonine/homoserine/homoserine lactone efflux protein
MAHFLAFLGVSIVVIVTPGPDTALTVRNTVLGSRRTGLLTALGVATGQAVWTLAAAAGIGALLVASEPAFLAVKFAGAAYLVWLGVQSLRAALRRSDPPGSHATVRPPRTMTAATAYRQGVVSDLGNPKMAAFFTSLLPQFDTSFAGMLALGLVFCLITFAWLALYATAVARAGEVLRRPRIRRTIDALTGAVLIGLGVRIATETR